MKIVDINGYVGYVKKKIQPGMSVEELLRRMDQAGVDEIVAWNTISSRQIMDGNAEMLDIAAASGGRIQRVPCRANVVVRIRIAAARWGSAVSNG